MTNKPIFRILEVLLWIWALLLIAVEINAGEVGLRWTPVFNADGYRVYCGPTATMKDARKMKLMLDENPVVKFTRIAKVRG